MNHTYHVKNKPERKKSTKNSQNHSWLWAQEQLVKYTVIETELEEKQSLIGSEKFELQSKRNSTKQHQIVPPFPHIIFWDPWTHIPCDGRWNDFFNRYNHVFKQSYHFWTA